MGEKRECFRDALTRGSFALGEPEVDQGEAGPFLCLVRGAYFVFSGWS